MGVTRIREISAKLVEHGLARRHARRHGPLGHHRPPTIHRRHARHHRRRRRKNQFTAPAVTVIGDVVKLRKTLNWFEKRPLFGKRIVVTRTREQASQLSRQLAELSAEVLEIPTIKIVPTDRKADLADALLELNSYDWIVFTSPNGVTMFFESFFKAL